MDSYDAAGQLTNAAVTNEPFGTIKDWTYTYGNHGNRLTEATTVGSTTTTTN